MKASDFPVALFVLFCKVVLIREHVDEILGVAIQMKAILSSTSLWYCLLFCTKWL